MNNLAEATTKIVEVLTTFNPEERIRIVKAALTLLGDDLNVSTARSLHGGSQRSENNYDNGDSEITEVHSLAQPWMRKNSITSEQLEHYFHFDQGRVIPIALPGNATTKREQSVNAYLTQGLASFLATGEASFTDADARKFCEQSGCYDSPNHAKSVKAFSNRITGSKSTGWKLTAPGLSAIADLIKQSKS